MASPSSTLPAASRVPLALPSTINASATGTSKPSDPRKNTHGFLKVGKKMATIFVGDDTEPFTVHWGLITATSDLFSKALNGDFRERDGVIRLPHHKPEEFACYVQWLYEGRFKHDENAWLTFLNLTVLGTFLQDRHFRNGVMGALIVKLNRREFCPTSLGPRAFTDLPQSSPFRKLVIGIWVCLGAPGWYGPKSRNWQHGPADLWRKIAECLVQFPEKRGTRPWGNDRCQYHEHVEGEAKCT